MNKRLHEILQNTRSNSVDDFQKQLLINILDNYTFQSVIKEKLSENLSYLAFFKTIH